MTFDPVAYWRRNAPSVYPAHRMQETELAGVLDGLSFASVLEVGCGIGRVTALLPPTARITVSDLNPDRVAATVARIPGATGIRSAIQDITSDARWDLVLCVEVLMHIPPSDIEAACHKLRALSARYVVTCDWTEPLADGRQPKAHNWLHDYAHLLRPTRTVNVGRQTIHVVDLG